MDVSGAIFNFTGFGDDMLNRTLIDAETTTIPTSPKIGEVGYVYENMQMYLPYVILSSFGMILGITGNCLIIGSILSHKDLRKNATCILILNLSFADMAISVIVDSFTVVGVFVGQTFFDKYISLCKFVAASCLIACGTSLVTMGFLAINRYISIFFNSHYNSIFQIKKTIVYCMLTWSAGFLVNLPNIIGWGDLVYDPKVMTCVFDRLKKVYTIAFVISCIIFPCLAIAFCYARIFWRAYRIKQKINSRSATMSNKARTSASHVLESATLAKCLFASFFLFAICWLPLAVIFLADLSDYLPASAHLFANLPAHLNSALNPIFYGIFNTKMREGYKAFTKALFCGKIFKTAALKTQTDPAPTSTQAEHTARTSIQPLNRNVQKPLKSGL